MRIESGRIVADLPCLRCGYNLRTLGAAAICPECGLPKRATLRVFKRAELSRRWVARTLLGLRLALTCLLAATVALLAGAAYLLLDALAAARLLLGLTLLVAIGFGCVAVGAGPFAALLLSTPLPDRFRQFARVSRRATRACLIVLLGILLGGIGRELHPLDWEPAAAVFTPQVALVLMALTVLCVALRVRSVMRFLLLDPVSLGAPRLMLYAAVLSGLSVVGVLAPVGVLVALPRGTILLSLVVGAVAAYDAVRIVAWPWVLLRKVLRPLTTG